jgi:hypothetical protein
MTRIGVRSAHVPIVVAALLAIMAAAPAHAGWNGEQAIPLGAKISAEFAGKVADETHRFTFFAPEGTGLTATLKVAKGATLVAEMAVTDLSGGALDLGGALKGTKIKKFVLEKGGWYYLQVKATDGTGGYSLKTKGKFPRKIVVTTDDDEVVCGALGGTLLSAQVKAVKGSAATPVIEEVTGPAEVDIGGETTSFKKVPLHATGFYILAIKNDAGVGQFDVKLSFKAPKSKVTLAFGPVDPPIVGHETEWSGSGHADAGAEAFRHWDEDGSISTRCAKCHSTHGFRDFLGDDGTAEGVVDNAAPLGTTVECDACHNDKAVALTSVTFPSGVTATGLGPEARCMQCHQGRESTVSLNEHIADAEVADDDTVDEDLSFRNIHYFAAGATLFGGSALGAYQYEGMIYDTRNPHVEAYDSCVECHDAPSVTTTATERPTRASPSRSRP